MANGGYGPRSETNADLFTWATAHGDVQHERWRHQQQRNADDDYVSEYATLHQRISHVDKSLSEMRGKITGWSAAGAFVGGTLVAVANILITIFAK